MAKEVSGTLRQQGPILAVSASMRGTASFALALLLMAPISHAQAISDALAACGDAELSLSERTKLLRSLSWKQVSDKAANTELLRTAAFLSALGASRPQSLPDVYQWALASTKGASPEGLLFELPSGELPIRILLSENVEERVCRLIAGQGALNSLLAPLPNASLHLHDNGAALKLTYSAANDRPLFMEVTEVFENEGLDSILAAPYRTTATILTPLSAPKEARP